MKKYFFPICLSLLFCGCQQYDTDPDKLLPWLDEMSLYAGEDVYSVDDSIPFLYNHTKSCMFKVNQVKNLYSQICCQGFNSAVLGIHHDGPVTDAGVICEIADLNDTLKLHIWKNKRNHPIVSICVNDIECEPFSKDLDL